MTRVSDRIAVSRRGQRGVGLIEVLIALLVLSFGMLGLAGLQMWSLKYNQSAMERGMAVVQTHSIIDAMRANRSAATTNQFDIQFDDPVPAGDSFTLAALRAWRTSLQAELGDQASGEIDCDGADCTISVRWNDARAKDVSELDRNREGFQTVTTEVQL
jgi:type IV pilus assembly protein PilV